MTFPCGIWLAVVTGVLIGTYYLVIRDGQRIEKLETQVSEQACVVQRLTESDEDAGAEP